MKLTSCNSDKSRMEKNKLTCSFLEHPNSFCNSRSEKHERYEDMYMTAQIRKKKKKKISYKI